MATIRRGLRNTVHAGESRDRLGISRTDIISVAETVEWWQPNRDEAVPRGKKYEMIGKDVSGRRLYTAGKEMIRDDQTVWLVITIHEAE